jgi:acetyl-CoA C-acetyltransferase
MGVQPAIVSAGYCKHASKRSDVNMPELINESIEDCLSKCNAQIDDIDCIINGNMPAFEGSNIPELWMTDHMGAKNKPVMRVTTGGTTGGSVAIAGYYAIASGMYETVMVTAFEHQSIGDTTIGLASVALGEFSIFLELGYDYDQLVKMMGAGAAIGIAAYQCSNYTRRSGANEEDLARVVVQNRRNAAKTWWAHLKMPTVTIGDVLDTPYISYPLRYGMVCPASDGACCMIYTTEENAKKLTDTPVYVNGVASVSNETAIVGMDASGAGQLDPCEQLGAQLSSKLAYGQAGIAFPRKEIDYAEVYAPFPNQELQWVERVGLFEPNTAPQMYKDGVTAWDGDLPINCSGGVNSTNAIGASAMERVSEAALQIMGKASNQVPKEVHTALGHGWGGAINLITHLCLADVPRRKYKAMRK